AVPSACSRYPPVGSGALLSQTPILSSPRKPPSNALLPVRSLRFTHQVQLSLSLWKARSSQSIAPCPRRICSNREVQMVDHACTGGVTSPKFHSYAAICPLGCR